MKYTHLHTATLLCFLVFVCGGCARTFRGPADGGPDWYEARTAHFRVRTDAGASEAERWAQDYERYYAVLANVAFPSADQPSGWAEVVLFANEDEYKEVAPEHSAGFFRIGGPPHAPHAQLVLEAKEGADVGPTLVHELVHRFVRHHFSGVPTWVNEGLAEFYETLEIQPQAVVIGGVPRGMRYDSSWGWQVHTGRRYDVLRKVAPPGPQLRELTPADFYAWGITNRVEFEETRAVHYAAAWAHVHLLMLGPHRQSFLKYLNGLKSGKTHESAWGAAFPEATHPELNRSYAAFLSREETKTARIPLRVEDGPAVTARVLSPSEVHEMWACLRPSKPGQLGPDAERAVALAPESATALTLRAMFLLANEQEDEAEADLVRARQLAPADPDVALPLATLYIAREYRKRKTQRDWRSVSELLAVLHRNAATATHLDFLAQFELARMRPERARALAAKAVEKDSSCVECYYTGALALAALGRWEEAAAAARVAAAARGEGAGSKGGDKNGPDTPFEEASEKVAGGEEPRLAVLPWVPASLERITSGVSMKFELSYRKDGSVGDVQVLPVRSGGALRAGNALWVLPTLAAVRAWRGEPPATGTKKEWLHLRQ